MDEENTTENDESFLPPSAEAKEEQGGVYYDAPDVSEVATTEPTMTEAEFREKFADEMKPEEPKMTEVEFRELYVGEFPPELDPPAKEDHVPEETIEAGTDRFLEFTLSGCYYNFRKEKIDFDDVKVKIPYCDEENGVGSMHVRRRFAAKAVKAEKNPDGTAKYPERIERMCQVYIDDIQETTGTLSFVGKDIKTLDIYQMQELAVAKDIRFIPLPSSDMSKRDRLIRTYVGYSDKILKKKVKWQEEGFNFAKLPAIILEGSGRFETHQKITNEEMIEQEQSAPSTELGKSDNPKNRFTIEELKMLADGKGIEYPDDVEFNDLYSHLFSA